MTSGYLWFRKGPLAGYFEYDNGDLSFAGRGGIDIEFWFEKRGSPPED